MATVELPDPYSLQTDWCSEASSETEIMSCGC